MVSLLSLANLPPPRPPAGILLHLQSTRSNWNPPSQKPAVQYRFVHSCLIITSNLARAQNCFYEESLVVKIYQWQNKSYNTAMWHSLDSFLLNPWSIGAVLLPCIHTPVHLWDHHTKKWKLLYKEIPESKNCFIRKRKKNQNIQREGSCSRDLVLQCSPRNTGEYTRMKLILSPSGHSHAHSEKQMCLDCTGHTWNNHLIMRILCCTILMYPSLERMTFIIL